MAVFELFVVALGLLGNTTGTCGEAFKGLLRSYLDITKTYLTRWDRSFRVDSEHLLKNISSSTRLYDSSFLSLDF